MKAKTTAESTVHAQHPVKPLPCLKTPQVSKTKQHFSQVSSGPFCCGKQLLSCGLRGGLVWPQTVAIFVLRATAGCDGVAVLDGPAGRCLLLPPEKKPETYPAERHCCNAFVHAVWLFDGHFRAFCALARRALLAIWLEAVLAQVAR